MFSLGEKRRQIINGLRRHQIDQLIDARRKHLLSGVEPKQKLSRELSMQLSATMR